MSERVLVLRSGSCSWGRCCFCGYGRIAGNRPSFDVLKNVFDVFFSGLGDVDCVKVFGSGSFFDERQVPEEARKYFIEQCMRFGVRRVVVESRPEYVKREVLEEFRGLDLTVAVGLEAADDVLLEKLGKGFTLRDFEEAAEVVHSCNAKLRTYILVNPPYVEDVKSALVRSVEYALKYSDSVVLINLLPHGSTPLFNMWVRGMWRFLSREEFYSLTERWRNNPRVELDVETFMFVPKFPKEFQEDLCGVGEVYLTHPHFEVWQDYLCRWYRPPQGKDFLLFLPCTNRKPYSRSKTHRGIVEVLKSTGFYGRIHEVMLSNAGLVPREFEDMYPFNKYDWDEKQETVEVKERYVEVTAERIRNYLKAHEGCYSKIFCFLRYDSESFKALKRVCCEEGFSFINLLSVDVYEKIKDDARPLQNPLALQCLREELIKNVQDESHSSY